MSEKDIIENLKDPEHLRYAVGRLISDAESEKDVRKRRNEVIDVKLKDLLEDKITRDATIKTAVMIFRILAWLNLGAIITFAAALIKFFSKN